MSDKRVTIAVNGLSEGAKLLIIPSSATLSEILDQAAAKLSEGASSPYTFTRVFVESGAEVMAANEIMAGDKLFLSGGENFIFASSSSASSAADAAASDAAKYHFLSTIAASAVAQAAALYEKSSNLVKEKGPEIVRVNLEKVETKASDLSAKYQIKDKVVGVSQPWIEWADTHVDAAYESVLKRKTSITQFLQSPLAQRVNETLVIPFRVRLQFSYSTLTDDFRTKSEEAFARIHQSVQAGKEKASDLRQHADAFISDMKLRLGSTWNDRLKEPALSYYSAVTSEYSELLKKADATKIQLQQLFLSTKEKLGDAWVRSVAAAYERYEVTYKQAFEAYTSKVKEPAAAFYVRGFEAYAALQQTSAKGVVTFEEFVAGLRLKMATLWTDRLIEPAKALYETFSAPANEKPADAPASS